MENVYEEKKEFVKNELFTLCKKIVPMLESLDYSRDQIRGLETVTAIYKDEDNRIVIREINVTADSLRYIVMDVVRFI